MFSGGIKIFSAHVINKLYCRATELFLCQYICCSEVGFSTQSLWSRLAENLKQKDIGNVSVYKFIASRISIATFSRLITYWMFY